jgi:hypothetical protein
MCRNIRAGKREIDVERGRERGEGGERETGRNTDDLEKSYSRVG